MEAPGHPVEVYRYIGRDLGIHLPFLPIPIPLPGDEAMGFALAVYDSNQKVTELATDI